MNFGRYPDYSPSSVGWLDAVPSHWKRVPIKYVALEPHSLFVDGDWIESKDLSDSGIRYLTTGNVGEGRFKEQGEGFISEEKFSELNCTEVFPGDMLVSRLNRPIGRACIVPELGLRIVTSVDNVILRADRRYALPFLVYLFSSKDYFRHTDNLSRGATMQRISRGLLGNIRIVVPPLEEQTQIARFLDYETAKIDALIEKQQQLIALLKEKRQAVISHAVTKGLDPKVPMRDSGSEWLGEVPAHWDTSRLKFLVSHVVDCHHSTPRYDTDGAFPALRTADVNLGCIDIHGARRVHFDEYVDRISRLRPEPGDIVYSREGERWGIAAPIPEGVEVCLAQRVMLFRANQLIDGEFLMWALNSTGVYNQLAVDVVGATSPHVNIGDIREVWVAVPPRSEQAEIVGHVREILEKLDRLDNQCAQVIATLQERRTALIAAVVTGKIDVRGWRAPEPFAEAEIA